MAHTICCPRVDHHNRQIPQRVIERPDVLRQSAKMMIADNRVDSESPVQLQRTHAGPFQGPKMAPTPNAFPISAHSDRMYVPFEHTTRSATSWPSATSST